MNEKPKIEIGTLFKGGGWTSVPHNFYLVVSRFEARGAAGWVVGWTYKVYGIKEDRYFTISERDLLRTGVYIRIAYPSVPSVGARI